MPTIYGSRSTDIIRQILIYDNHVMKRFLLAIVTIAATFSGAEIFAQGRYGADSAECVKYLSYYKEYFKQKNYNEAMPSWRKAYELCPASSMQTMLVDGTSIVRYFIAKNSKDESYRDALIDTLMTLHDKRIENFPAYGVAARNAKGLDINNYFKGDPERQFQEYNAIIEANREKTMPTIFLFDLNVAVTLFQAGKLGADDVMKTYEKNMSYIQNEKASAALDQAKSDLEGLLISSKVASCDNLIELFGPRFEANPNDLDLATNIVKMMNFAEGCTDNELYLKAASAMYRLNPSSAAAHALFLLNASKGKTEDAIRYAEEAIASPESDSATDGDYYLELSAFCLKNGMNGKAFEAAKAAAEASPAVSGKAYMIIATIWGSVSCGGNEIEKRAPYWVAVDYLIKAKVADESLTDEANRLIGQYSKYYPQTAEAFMYEVTDGQSYTVSCGGMRANTIVRTQK